jgi:hypothetical protein
MWFGTPRTQRESKRTWKGHKTSKRRQEHGPALSGELIPLILSTVEDPLGVEQGGAESGACDLCVLSISGAGWELSPNHINFPQVVSL